MKLIKIKALVQREDTVDYERMGITPPNVAQEDLEEVDVWFSPSQICYFEKSIEVEGGTVFVLTSGSAFNVNMPPQEFEKFLGL
jgi:hypothetical protein